MAYMLYGRETVPVDYDPGPMMVDSLGAAPVTGIKINKPMTERAGRVILEDASHYYVALADVDDDAGLPGLGEITELDLPDNMDLNLAALAPPRYNAALSRQSGRMVLEDRENFYLGLSDTELPEEIYLGDVVFIPVRQGIEEGLGGFGSFFKKAFKKVKKVVKKVGHGIKKAAKKVGKVAKKVFKKIKKPLLGAALITAGIVAGATGIGLPVAGALIGMGVGTVASKGTGFGTGSELFKRMAIGGVAGAAVGAAIAYAPAIAAGAKAAGGGIMAAGKWVGSGLLSAGGKLFSLLKGGSVLGTEDTAAEIGSSPAGTLFSLGDKLFSSLPGGSAVEMQPGGGEGGGGGGGGGEEAPPEAPPEAPAETKVSTTTLVLVGLGAVVLLVMASGKK